MARTRPLRRPERRRRVEHRAAGEEVGGVHLALVGGAVGVSVAVVAVGGGVGDVRAAAVVGHLAERDARLGERRNLQATHRAEACELAGEPPRDGTIRVYPAWERGPRPGAGDPTSRPVGPRSTPPGLRAGRRRWRRGRGRSTIAAWSRASPPAARSGRHGSRAPRPYRLQELRERERQAGGRIRGEVAREHHVARPVQRERVSAREEPGRPAVAPRAVAGRFTM